MFSRLESVFCKKFEKSNSLFVGSGTSAIYVTLKALNLRQNDAVLLPGICCLSPVYAVKYAGLNVDFCDVSRTDGCTTPALLEAALTANPSIKVFIAVHLYGNVLEIHTIADICKRNNVILIEDACQAYGSAYDNRPCGSFGDFSILSFGHTKVIDAGGGGLVLTDNDSAAKTIRSECELLPNNGAVKQSELAHSYSIEYYQIQEKILSGNGPKTLYSELYLNYRTLFLSKGNKTNEERILNLLPQETRIFERRLGLSSEYENYLNRYRQVHILRSRQHGVPWRFCFLISEIDNNVFCNALRALGFSASSWYPNLAEIFSRDYHRTLIVANEFESRIVNLWLDESTDRSMVANLCNAIGPHLT